jgi:hypothetical protein
MSSRSSRRCRARRTRALVRRFEEGLNTQDLKASLGVAVYPDDGTTALSLFRAADARLYDRKLLRYRLVTPAADPAANLRADQELTDPVHACLFWAGRSARHGTLRLLSAGS